MKRVILCCLMALATLASHATEMEYVIRLDTTKHYLNVELTLNGQGAQPEVCLKMPVWAPGYYLIMDYPKHLTDFQVKDASGNPLPWRKEGKSSWYVKPQGNNAIHISYRIFANMQSVADSRVNANTAFIAPNGVFLYRDQAKELPVQVTFDRPQNWAHTSTGLKKIGEDTYLAKDFDTLYDSPVLMGNQLVKTFELDGHAYELAMETPDGFEETTFEQDIKKMIHATTQLMGDVPYENYCFLLLRAGGGGLEHLNSQASYTSGSFRFRNQAAYLNFLSFITHEYYHLYNVKSIRPIELGPFDYDKEVFTPLLWVSEGFTVYYETRNLLRAGIIDTQYVLKEMEGFIQDTEKHEGHRHMSLRESSYDIWLQFFNRSANNDDVRISYYIKGPVLGLLFDAQIRTLTKGKKSLDDLMRLLYNRYCKQLNRGFTEEEFWAAAAEVAGEKLDLLRRYVDTTDEIDYNQILNPIGLYLDDNLNLKFMEKATKEQVQLRQAMFQ